MKTENDLRCLIAALASAKRGGDLYKQEPDHSANKPIISLVTMIEIQEKALGALLRWIIEDVEDEQLDKLVNREKARRQLK
jgi:hypothetical protein